MYLPFSIVVSVSVDVVTRVVVLDEAALVVVVAVEVVVVTVVVVVVVVVVVSGITGQSRSIPLSTL